MARIRVSPRRGAADAAVVLGQQIKAQRGRPAGVDGVAQGRGQCIDQAAFKPVGDTDSELAFCWLLQELNKSHAGVPSVEELTHTLRELVPRISKHGTFNFLLSNGQALWAHASTKLCYVLRQHPFSEVHLKDDDLKVDLADLNGPEDRLAIVVTEDLTIDRETAADITFD